MALEPLPPPVLRARALVTLDSRLLKELCDFLDTRASAISAFAFSARILAARLEFRVTWTPIVSVDANVLEEAAFQQL